MARELQQCCGRRGLVMADYLGVLEENPQDRNRNPIVRVERMLGQMKSRLPKLTQFLLCVLPESLDP